MLRLRSTLILLAALASFAAPASAVAATGSGGAAAADEPAPAAVTAPSRSGGARALDAAPAAPAASPSRSGGAVAGDAAPVARPIAPPVPVAPPAPAPVAPPAPAPLPTARLAELPYASLIAATAQRHGLAPSLLAALVWQESGFRPTVRSKAGARGLTQLMPGTARDLGVRRVYDPAENLDGGARYLKGLLVRFRRVDLALAAYNAGPENVAKHRGIPPFAETRRYVRNVLALEARLRGAR